MADHSSVNSDIIRVLNRLQAQQAIVVIWGEGFKADLGLYELVNGNWRLIQQMAANVGRNGMGKAMEGDLKSPSGTFSLGTAFGIAAPPVGSRYPYRLVTETDYWVDDSRSRSYNSWVRYREGEPKDWQSAEWLWRETVCYQYAVVVNYNPDRESGKGSAIFLHVWKDENTPTQGCTAVAKDNMMLIIQWLDNDKKPVIIQGTEQDIMRAGEFCP